jgi:hypothetical protein
MRDIVNEIGINRKIDHLSRVKDVTTKVQTYQFEINEIKYVTQFSVDTIGNDTVLSVSFRNITAIEKLKSKKNSSPDDFYSDMDRAKFGLTKTGSSMSVFNEVYNIVLKYIESKKPTYVKYEAVEDNRKKLYSTLIKRAEKETTLKFERIFVDPFTNCGLTDTSQIAVYKVHY